jgi:hypothetical protein
MVCARWSVQGGRELAIVPEGIVQVAMVRASHLALGCSLLVVVIGLRVQGGG